MPIDRLPEFDRRQLLSSAILLVGGTLAVLPAAATAQTAGQSRFFDEARFALLEEISDIIIPRTDTPGARDAGVAGVIDSLMRDWATPERARAFGALLDAVDLLARSEGAASFVSLPPPRRVELIRSFDASRIAAGDSTYSKFKELVLTAYYLSEPGATKELRYELVPGSWQAGVPVGPDTRAWAV